MRTARADRSRREHPQVAAVGLEGQDLVHVRRLRRAVVAVVQEADVDADVQASVRSERDAVEAIELLRRGPDHLLLGELGAVPAAPGLELPGDPFLVSEAPLMYSVPLRQVRPPTKPNAALHPRRLAALEHEHATVGRLVVALAASVTFEHGAASERERGRVLSPVANSLTCAPLAPVGGGGPVAATAALAIAPVDTTAAAVIAAVRPHMRCPFFAPFGPRPDPSGASVTQGLQGDERVSPDADRRASPPPDAARRSARSAHRPAPAPAPRRRRTRSRSAHDGRRARNRRQCWPAPSRTRCR